MTTHILLDIDGVVNAIYPLPIHKEISDLSGEWKEGYVDRYKFHWNQEVIDFLNDLFIDNNLVILSTWRQWAIDKVFPLVGLAIPEGHIVLDPLTDPESAQDIDPTNWWKARFAREFMEAHPGDKFIWIDDDLKYAPQTSWLSDDTLTVSPASSVGISRDDMVRINTFLASA